MERGKPVRPRTFPLPSASANPLEFSEANDRFTVSAMVSYSEEIAWTFAKSLNEALAKFNTPHQDGHVEYFIYRAADNQYEIPCAGEPGNLYIRAYTATANTDKGLSICFLSGGERI